MATWEQLGNARTYVPRHRKADATEEPKPKRLGRLHHLVFSPDGRRVVGAMVKRPDVAGMVKREDQFVALDRIFEYENGVIVQGDDAFDGAAAKRLGIDLDRCLIWDGMDVVTEKGDPLGYVVDIEFDGTTGELRQVNSVDSGMSQSLVGSVPIPGDLVLGYRAGAMVVKNEAKDLQLTGGIMGAAGTAVGKAQVKAKEAGEKTGKVVGEAVDKGSFALGRAIGHARNAVQEAMADDDPCEMPAPEGDAHKPEPDAQDTEPPLYVPSGSYESDIEKKAGEPQEPAKPKESTVDAATKAVGRQLGKTKGMFGAFMKEFKEASK